MLFSIDRIVGKTAVLIDERGKPMDVPLRMLPPGAKAGQMVEYENGQFGFAHEKAAMRRETMAEVLGQMLARGDEIESGPETVTREPDDESPKSRK